MDRPTKLSSVVTFNSMKTPLVQPKLQWLSDLSIHCRVFPNAYYVENPAADTVIKVTKKKKKKKKREREDEAYLLSGNHTVWKSRRCVYFWEVESPQTDGSLVQASGSDCGAQIPVSYLILDIFNYKIYEGNKQEYFQHSEWTLKCNRFFFYVQLIQTLPWKTNYK